MAESFEDKCNMKAKAFHVGFYVPEPAVSLQEFVQYYDDNIGLSLRPKPSRFSPELRDLVKEVAGSETLRENASKGTFGTLSTGALMGGYVINSEDTTTTFGPNETVLETVRMIEFSISKSSMDHGYVMVYLFTDLTQAPDFYYVMNPDENKLRLVSLEEYLDFSSSRIKSVTR